MRRFRWAGPVLVAASGLVAGMGYPAAAGAAPPANIRVTVDNGTNGSYVSADMMGGTGTYTDAALQRCSVDRRMQNEPAIAIDPRNTAVRTSGHNDYCGVPTNGDAWAGFYRSTTSGASWTDSLLPGYPLDASPQGCGNQGPNFAFGPAGQVYLSWIGTTGGTKGQKGADLQPRPPGGPGPTR